MSQRIEWENERKGYMESEWVSSWPEVEDDDWCLEHVPSSESESQTMGKERAVEILRAMDNSPGPCIQLNLRGPREVLIDGYLGFDELEALAWWLKNEKGDPPIDEDPG